MNRRWMIPVILGAALLMGVSAAAAQGSGNGNGNGRGGNGSNTADSDGPPYGSGYRSGSGTVDIVDPDTGQVWNRPQQASRGQMGLYSLLPPAVDGALPDTVVAAMIDGLNDERAAYAAYQSVMTQLGEVRPFVNIMAAEAQHMAAWEFMFERYGVALPPEPAVDAPAFATLSDACQFAVNAEVNNAGLYDGMMATFAAYPDLLQVTTALRNASNYNHLPAFQNCAS